MLPELKGGGELIQLRQGRRSWRSRPSSGPQFSETRDKDLETFLVVTGGEGCYQHQAGRGC